MTSVLCLQYLYNVRGKLWFCQFDRVKLIIAVFLSVLRVTEVLGYKPQDLLNELCYDFFHPDDLEHMMESYQQGLSILFY